MPKIDHYTPAQQATFRALAARLVPHVTGEKTEPDEQLFLEISAFMEEVMPRELQTISGAIAFATVPGLADDAPPGAAAELAADLRALAATH